MTNTTRIASLLKLALSAPALAQSDIVPAKAQSRPIAVIHAVVHTATAETPEALALTLTLTLTTEQPAEQASVARANVAVIGAVYPT